MLNDIGFSNDFLVIAPKAQQYQKIDKLKLMQTLKMCALKTS